MFQFARLSIFNSSDLVRIARSVTLFLREVIRFGGRKTFIAFALVVCGAVLEGIGLVLVVPLLSVIFDSSQVSGWAGWFMHTIFGLFSVESATAKLTSLLSLFGLIMLLRGIIIVRRDVIMAQLQTGFVQQVRMRVIIQLAAGNWQGISRLRHSRITHLLGGEIQQLSGLTHTIMHDVVAVTIVLTQALIAISLAPLLAMLTFGLLFLGAVILLPLIARARRIGASVTQANYSLVNDVTQFLGGLKLAISHNLEKDFTREFANLLDKLAKAEVRYILQQSLTRVAYIAAFAIIAAIVVLLARTSLEVSPFVLMALLLILSRMIGPAMQLQIDAQRLAFAAPVYEDLRTLEHELTPTKREAYYPNSICIRDDAPIVFGNVTYFHDNHLLSRDRRFGLRNLDLTIEPGTILGITGASGSGKTTFADLLVGLYPPNSGRILVGDVALQGPVMVAWRNRIGYVAQDPFLFHDSIRRNLMWFHPDAHESTLWQALHIAGADEIVRRTADGLETIVGERGALLSGGERQRICIARAILRRPKLLVLDEATSAIDTEGEASLVSSLMRERPGLTTIIIAHRAETLRHCDRIIVLERGKLIADGDSSKILGTYKLDSDAAPIGLTETG